MAALLNTGMLGFDDAEIDAALGLLTVPDDTPAIFDYADAYAVPGLSGLYDAGGRFIPTTAGLFTTSSRVDPLSLLKIRRQTDKFSPPLIDLEERLRRTGSGLSEVESACFLGNYGAHFGHWVIDDMARLWAGARGTTAIMPPIRGQERAGAAPHIAPLLDHAGVSAARRAAPTRVTRFDRVLVPEPAFQSRFTAYRAADRAHVGFARGLPRRDGPRKVYLSRRRLSGGIRTIVGEEVAEAWFNRLGYESIHPETLSLAGQISMFNTAEVIAGLDGSAFHAGMFALPGYRGKLIMLCGNDTINTRLILQNALKTYRAFMVRCFRYRTDGRRVGTLEIDIDMEKLRDLCAAIA